MKRLLFCLGLGCAALLPAFAAAEPESPAAQAPADRPVLQVQVSVPAAVDPLHEDDIVEVFADSLREAFRRRGYAGRIEELDWRDDPRRDQPLVSVRLLRWERTRTGSIDCTFSASVRPVEGKEESLGSFTQTELGLGVTSRWTLHQAFRDAAERASEQMYRRLAKLGVIPGLGEKQS